MSDSNDELELLKSTFHIEYGMLNETPIGNSWSKIGSLRWSRGGGVGPSKHEVGDVVGSVNFYGYLVFKLKFNGIKRSYICHRIVKTIELNRLLKSDEIVDHIDGNKLNNDPRNLRIVTQLENSRNKRHARSDSRDSLMGVSILPSGKWRVRLNGVNKDVNRHLGVYSLAVDACNRYWSAKIALEPDMQSTWSVVWKSQVEIAHTLDSKVCNADIFGNREEGSI